MVERERKKKKRKRVREKGKKKRERGFCLLLLLLAASRKKKLTVRGPRGLGLVELLVEGPVRSQAFGRAVVGGAAVAAAAPQADDALFFFSRLWGFSPFDLTNFLFSSAGGEKIEMGGDDVLGRPLGGACVPTQLMLSDLKEASQDASLPQASRSSEEKEGGRGGGTRTENPLPIRSRRSQKKKNSTSFFFLLFQPRKKTSRSASSPSTSPPPPRPPSRGSGPCIAPSVSLRD